MRTSCGLSPTALARCSSFGRRAVNSFLCGVFFAAGILLFVATANAFGQSRLGVASGRGSSAVLDVWRRIGTVAYALTARGRPQPIVFGMLGPTDQKPLDPERHSTALWAEYSRSSNGAITMEIKGQLAGNPLTLCSASRTFPE